MAQRVPRSGARVERDGDDELEEKDERSHSGEVPDSSPGGRNVHTSRRATRDWQDYAREDAQDEPRSPTKLGLAFILHGQREVQARPSWGPPWIDEGQLVSPLAAAAAASVEASPWSALSALPSSPPGHDRSARRRPRSASTGVAALSLTSPARSPQAHASSEQTRNDATVSRRQGRMCKADGCTNYIVHKGLCCRHGGGKKCSVDGCDSSAKHGGRCWKHGGSVDCKVDGCTKKAKAKGLCWAHGGGAKCQADACAKVAISNGFCWAHGGGKRCIFDGCQRPAFERTHSFCLRHYDELQDVDYYEV